MVWLLQVERCLCRNFHFHTRRQTSCTGRGSSLAVQVSPTGSHLDPFISVKNITPLSGNTCTNTQSIRINFKDKLNSIKTHLHKWIDWKYWSLVLQNLLVLAAKHGAHQQACFSGVMEALCHRPPPRFAAASCGFPCIAEGWGGRGKELLWRGCGISDIKCTPSYRAAAITLQTKMQPSLPCTAAFWLHGPDSSSS